MAAGVLRVGTRPSNEPFLTSVQSADRATNAPRLVTARPWIRLVGWLFVWGCVGGERE